MIHPDPHLLANNRALSAVLNELAPAPQDLAELERLDLLDRVIAGLLTMDDQDKRVLLCEFAANHLKLPPRMAVSRLKRAADDWSAHLEAEAQKAEQLAALERQRLAAEAAAIAAREQAEALRKRPPLDRFNDLVATASDGWQYLLFAVAPAPVSLDAAAKLRAADELIDVLVPLPDQELRVLYAREIADHLGLKPREILDRLKRAQNAPTAPAGPVVGGEIKDGGFHHALTGALRRYLETRGIEPDAVNGWLDAKGKPTSIKTRDLVNLFHFTHAAYFESLPRDRIDITLAGMIQERRDQRRTLLLSRIVGRPADPRGTDEMRRWLMATTHRDDPTDLAIMRHFIWQVKRLNSGRTVEWDLMPIFRGGQGDGKSTAIRRLLLPLAELMINVNAKTLEDERCSEVLGDYVVGFWGEMSGGNKAEINALKQTMTSEKKNYRELGGHHFNSVIRRMVFIGDCNNPVKDILSDNTGMRRFYEIVVNGRTDHDVINTFDPLLAWSCVSEDDPPPFNEVATVVKDRQRELVAEDTFDHFIAWCDERRWQRLVVVLTGMPYGPNGQQETITVPTYVPKRGYTLAELCVLFRHYVANVAGGVQRGDQYVSKRIRECGWIDHRPRVDADGKPIVGPRPRYWKKPERPAEPDDDQTPTTDTRGARWTATPSAAEDAFASQATGTQPSPATAQTTGTTVMESPEREPGADEDEGPYRPEGDDAPLDP